MITPFILEIPKHIYFGPGIHEKLFDVIHTLNFKRVLFLTGKKWFAESGWKAQFEAKLKVKKYQFIPCAQGEPDTDGINTILKEIKKFKPSTIISIGGGAVIDTGKACAVLATQGKQVEDFLEGIGKPQEITKPGICHIAIPTTAGTGAEATKNAVIKSKAHQAKKSMRSPLMLPDYVFIDPQFALNLGKQATGITGMDALVQLFEAYTSKKAKPVIKSMIKTAFPLFFTGLQTLAEDRSNLEARTDAAYGAFISGVALANSGLGAVHGFASSLGGLTDIPHGLICAVFFNAVLEANQSQIIDAVSELCYPGKTGAREAQFQAFKKTISGLIAGFELDKEFKKYTIKEEWIPVIAQKASGSSMSGNPRELSQTERESIIRNVLSQI